MPKISKTSCEVFVIGGGIIGTSIAYHLTKIGAQNIILAERNPILGDESTGKSVGGVRHQFAEPANILLSKHSIERFRHYAQELEIHIDFRQYGYLFLANTQQRFMELRAQTRIQNQLGVPTAMLTPGEIHALAPYLHLDGVLGASYCDLDGYLDPHCLLQGFAKQCKKAGVHIMRSCPVHAIHRKGKDFIIDTAQGRFTSPVLVNAAGPWAGHIAGMAGHFPPLTVTKRHVFLSHPTRALPGTIPLILQETPPFYIRREGPCLLFSPADQSPHPSTERMRHKRLEEAAERVLTRIPALRDLTVMRSWWGLRPLSPDGSAMVGPVDTIPGYFCAIGFSGHGVMHAPLVGELLAEYIRHGRTRTMSIHALDPARFGIKKTSQR